MTDSTRRDVLRAGIALGAASALPMQVAADALVDDRSPVVDAGDGLLWGWSVPTDRVIHRYGEPSWIVRHDGNRESELDEWATKSDARRVIDHSASVDAALVSAPQDAVHTLLEYGWTASLDLDIRMELVEPVVPPSDGALGLTDVSRADAFLIAGGVNPLRERLNTDALKAGLAYSEDMPDATITDTKGYTNAVSATVTDTAVVLDTGCNSGAVFEDSVGETRILDASADYTDPDRPTVGESGLSVVADDNGHGTWVTSCMAGSGDSMDGYAPNSDILVLRVLDDGEGSSWDIAEAIRYAADQVGQGGVANLSLGSPVYSYELDKAISYAAGAGLPCVVAAGNDRHKTKWVNSPADSPEAITVTAATAEPPADAKSAAYHNHDPDSSQRDLSAGHTAGSHVDVMAPGCKVEVETPTGTSRLTGTSMAAPHVAGGLLQLFANDSTPKGDLEAIRARLHDYSAPMPKAGVTEAGHGYLDVDAMVNETQPDETQEQARDAKAQGRDKAHRRLSNGEGGLFWRHL